LAREQVTLERPLPRHCPAFSGHRSMAR